MWSPGPCGMREVLPEAPWRFALPRRRRTIRPRRDRVAPIDESGERVRSPRPLCAGPSRRCVARSCRRRSRSAGVSTVGACSCGVVSARYRVPGSARPGLLDRARVRHPAPVVPPSMRPSKVSRKRRRRRRVRSTTRSPIQHAHPASASEHDFTTTVIQYRCSGPISRGSSGETSSRRRNFWTRSPYTSPT